MLNEDGVSLEDMMMEMRGGKCDSILLISPLTGKVTAKCRSVSMRQASHAPWPLARRRGRQAASSALLGGGRNAAILLLAHAVAGWARRSVV